MISCIQEVDTEVENFPAGLLRANYVVDLTVRPGRLLPCNGREARNMCGPKCAPPYTAGTRPDICVCEVPETSVKDDKQQKKMTIADF